MLWLDHWIGIIRYDAKN